MAVENSVKQMALTRNQEFMDRNTAVLTFVAGKVLDEPADTPYHEGRVRYAKQVVQMPTSASVTAAPQVCMGINIVNTTTYDEATKTSTCTATDAEFESQVTTLFNALAGLDTPT